MNLALAILRVLAQHNERYLPIDEMKREMLKLAGGVKYAEVHFWLAGNALSRGGLISKNISGWRITEPGLSMVRSLEPAAPVAANSLSTLENLLQSVEQLDVIEQSARWKKDTLSASNETEAAVEDVPALSAAEESAAAPHGNTPGGPDYATADHTTPIDVVGILANPADDSNIPSPPQRDRKSRLSSFLGTLASTKETVLLRRLELRSARNRIAYKAKVMGRSAARLTPFVLIGLLACGVAAGLLMQLSFFRRENAELQREVSRLRENFSKLEQAIKTEKNDSEKNAPASSMPPSRMEPTGFQLSREETQLIKDFIKPAPNLGASGPNAAVGDPIEGTLIPLPPALVEKAPRLAGARFAIRNSNIIIVTRGSNRVDAVLPTN